jgi:hypothetical protein
MISGESRRIVLPMMVVSQSNKHSPVMLPGVRRKTNIETMKAKGTFTMPVNNRNLTE